MAYVADPTDAARPADSEDASGGAAELRALKGYIQTLLVPGGTIPVTGYAWQGFRNKLINGNFDIWQRGTSFAAGTGRRYLADRWATESIGTTIAPSRQAHALGQTLVPNEPTYFHRCVVVSVAGAGNFASFTQRFEGVRTFAGKTVTASFYCKADAVKNIAVEFKQSFGTGGAPSADVTAIGVTTKTLSTGFALYTVTAAIPSISGKTLGTVGNDFLEIAIWMDAGSTFNARTNSLGQQSGTFDFSQIQVEEGSTATPFELLPLAVIVAQCEKFYEKSYDLAVIPATVTPTGAASWSFISSNRPINQFWFKTRKRTVPNLTLYNPATGAGGTARDNDGGADRSMTVSSQSEAGFSAFATGAMALGNALAVHWVAEAEL